MHLLGIIFLLLLVAVVCGGISQFKSGTVGWAAFIATVIACGIVLLELLGKA